MGLSGKCRYVLPKGAGEGSIVVSCTYGRKPIFWRGKDVSQSSQSTDSGRVAIKTRDMNN